MTTGLDYTKFSGSLFYASKRADFWTTLKQNSQLCGELVSQQPGWYQFFVSPERSWIKSEIDSGIRPNYEFRVRRGSGGRVMIVSTRKGLVPKFLSEIGLSEWVGNTPSVDIGGLMGDLMETPRTTEYTLGAVHARVSAFRGALRTVILYGNDIADADLFRESLADWIEPYRVALRLSKSYEVVSISEVGEVTFDMRNPRSFEEVDTAIRVIGQELGRLDWSTENHD